MKKTIFILIVFCSLYSSAQLPPHPPGSYIINTNIDKFVGTWISISGTDTLTIVLHKEKIFFPNPLSYDQDMLIGWHRYVKNGQLIESSLQYVGDSYSNGHFTLFGTSENSTKVRFTTFIDLSKNKISDNLRLTIKGNQVPFPRAVWELKNSQGLKIGGYDFGFTVPQTLVLYKN